MTMENAPNQNGSRDVTPLQLPDQFQPDISDPQIVVPETSQAADVIDFVVARTGILARRRMKERTLLRMNALVGQKVVGDSIMLPEYDDPELAEQIEPTEFVEHLGTVQQGPENAEMGLFSNKKKVPKRLSRYEKEVLRGKRASAKDNAKVLRSSVGFGNKDVAAQKRKAKKAKDELNARRDAKRARRKARRKK